jgi:putative ATP-binding cassette transporter
MPTGEKLLENINEVLQHGRHYIIKGDSGIGKSTFIRVLAGIWPYGSGQVILPQQKMLFVPQRAYMPLGTLRDALLFPDEISGIKDQDLQELLDACELPHLKNSLNDVTRWRERLSPGEMQRIAFVRVILQKPDWAFLDESTSSLDLKRENLLYQLLKIKLPHCSLVSVGHRPSLDAFHDEVINLEKYYTSR